MQALWAPQFAVFLFLLLLVQVSDPVCKWTPFWSILHFRHQMELFQKQPNLDLDYFKSKHLSFHQLEAVSGATLHTGRAGPGVPATAPGSFTPLDLWSCSGPVGPCCNARGLGQKVLVVNRFWAIRRNSRPSICVIVSAFFLMISGMPEPWTCSSWFQIFQLKFTPWKARLFTFRKEGHLEPGKWDLVARQLPGKGRFGMTGAVNQWISKRNLAQRLDMPLGHKISECF